MKKELIKKHDLVMAMEQAHRLVGKADYEEMFLELPAMAQAIVNMTTAQRESALVTARARLRKLCADAMRASEMLSRSLAAAAAEAKSKRPLAPAPAISRRLKKL
jgi:hypothetical protein